MDVLTMDKWMELKESREATPEALDFPMVGGREYVLIHPWECATVQQNPEKRRISAGLSVGTKLRGIEMTAVMLGMPGEGTLLEHVPVEVLNVMGDLHPDFPYGTWITKRSIRPLDSDRTSISSDFLVGSIVRLVRPWRVSGNLVRDDTRLKIGDIYTIKCGPDSDGDVEVIGRDDTRGYGVFCHSSCLELVRLPEPEADAVEDWTPVEGMRVRLVKPWAWLNDDPFTVGDNYAMVGDVVTIASGAEQNRGDVRIDCDVPGKHPQRGWWIRKDCLVPVKDPLTVVLESVPVGEGDPPVVNLDLGLEGQITELRAALVREEQRRVDELQALRQQMYSEQSTHESFKRRVERVAMEYAKDHGWCSQVDQALQDMGLEAPKARAEFTVTVTYRVNATSCERYCDVSESSVTGSMTVSEDGIQMNDDWTDVEVDVVDWNTDEVEITMDSDE